MRISSFVSFFGFVLLIAGTFSPLLRFGLFKWDIYGLNKPYGIVILVIAVAGILGSILQQRAITKFSAFIALLLVVLLYVGVVFKVNTSFSFIPFKDISAGLTRIIKFKWGWFMLFGGAIIAVIGAITNKPVVMATAPI